MKNSLKVGVISGPNLNLIQERDPVHYGDSSLDSIREKLESEFLEVEFHFFHSNIEGELIQHLQEQRKHLDGFIVNLGGFSHSSVALMDTLSLIAAPKIEVHLSHLAAREDFRQVLLTARACDGYISGFKAEGYSAAVYLLLKLIKGRQNG
ncbi:MAG: 3-dehydroquinate dehydratase [Ignavibacteriaceae bacterium]|nr:3-dehydroquinate dehydratase [Ignavibacteriaceae bacterium]